MTRSRRRRASAVTGLALAAALLAPVPAAAQEATLELVDRGRVQRDGSAVVTLLVRCDPALQVLEANLSVSQDAVSVLTGVGGVSCTGRTRRVRVVVTPLEGGFERGAAYASAFLLLLDPATGTTVQAQDVETITL